MHRYLDAGFHRYTFRRSFYGLVHFYALLHSKKSIAFAMLFCNDVFRCAERAVPCGRDVCFASDVRFAREKRNTSHHFAASPQNITFAARQTDHILLKQDISRIAPRVRLHLSKTQVHSFVPPRQLDIARTPIISAAGSPCWYGCNFKTETEDHSFRLDPLFNCFTQ